MSIALTFSLRESSRISYDKSYESWIIRRARVYAPLLADDVVVVVGVGVVVVVVVIVVVYCCCCCCCCVVVVFLVLVFVIVVDDAAVFSLTFLDARFSSLPVLLIFFFFLFLFLPSFFSFCLSPCSFSSLFFFPFFFFKHKKE